MNLNLRGTDAKSTGDWDGSIAYRNLKQRICPTIEATFEAKEVFGEINRDASTAEKITGLEFEEIRINHREHNFTLPTWEEFKDNIKTTLSKGWEEALGLLKVEHPIELPVEGLPWLVNIPKIEVVEEEAAKEEVVEEEAPTSEAELKMCLINREFVDELLAKSRDEAKYKEFVKKQLQKRIDLKLLNKAANKEAFDRYMREVYETSPDDGASSYGYAFQRFSEFMQDVPEDNIIVTWAVRPLAKVGNEIVTGILNVADTFTPDLDTLIRNSVYENFEGAGIDAGSQQIDEITTLAVNNLKEAVKFTEFTPTPTQQYGMEALGTGLDAVIVGGLVKNLVVNTGKAVFKNTVAQNLAKTIAPSKLQNLYYTRAITKIIDDVKFNPTQPVSEIVGKIYSESNDLQTKLLGASDDAWKVPTTGVTSSFDGAKIIREVDHFKIDLLKKQIDESGFINKMLSVRELEDKAIGTHVMSRHVGKGVDDYVARHNAAAKKSGVYHPDAYTGFTDEVTADYVVSRIMVENMDEINDWLKYGTSLTKPFSLDFGFKIGEGVTKADYLSNIHKIRDFNKGNVVFKRAINGRFEKDGIKFDILTAYPIL